ncbi:DUF4167 domain-containing protein [Devosia sp.]|uniref:DUF4167 domain-containing protein n=1 Tax=Devosia sp. TaxID=1871048 RepID=UPI002AFF7CE3|nr:DUF4167 domain-containing protein [Devosia sp.]
MRPNNQNKNRQRGRNGGRKHVNPLSRNFESNGPDVKVRGNAAHIAEKYLQLARDAQSSGDSVMAENYLQHAEHYFRIVSSAQQAMSGQRPEGQDDGDFDDDMPDMNSRFASPQPVVQQNFTPTETEASGEDEARPAQAEARPEGERPVRNERRNRNRDRAPRPEGEGAPALAGEGEQPAIDVAPAEAAEEGAEGEGEARKPRERRPRRRRPAGGDAGAEAAGDAPEGGLPAFLTAGSTSAAE